MRRFLVRFVAVVACLVAAAPAAAFSPEAVVTGSSTSKWFSGSLIQQYGENCSTAILGSSYSEVMVSGIGSYGGASGGGLVRVGDQYWTALLVAIPGNPCGPGSAVVETDVVLPPGTNVDTTRQIQCFGVTRSSSSGFDATLTGAPWTAFGSTGQYCPTHVGASSIVPGALSVGFRPLASGQMFQIFLPVKSTGVLPSGGSQVNPDGFRWLTQATGVYANPGLSTTNAYVFPGSTQGTNPSVYFARTPSAQPWWNPAGAATSVAVGNVPAHGDQRNSVELWANVYTAGKGGTLSYAVVRNDTHAQIWSSAQDQHWNGAVAAGQDLIQVTPGDYGGPNGGYAPVAFDPPGTVGNLGGEWDVPMTVTWTFTPTSGPAASASTDFRTLSGPDSDHDGVADAFDACPDKAGNAPNGCTPVTPVVTLDQLGGDIGKAGLCGIGAAAACPAATPTPVPAGVAPAPPASGVSPAAPAAPSGPAAPAAKAFATLTLGKQPKLARKGLLAKGASVPGTCTPGGSATLSLIATKATAKALKLKTKPTLPTLGTAVQACAASGATTFTLKLAGSLAKKVKKAKGKLTATLSLTTSVPGSTAAVATAAVTLT